jgi:hypothetical protein
MNKMQFDILKCCYKKVCSSEDIKILLKITQLQFDLAVDKLISYVTKYLGNLSVTPAGKFYVEAVK